jgi:hypothetical protein
MEAYQAKEQKTRAVIGLLIELGHTLKRLINTSPINIMNHIQINELLFVVDSLTIDSTEYEKQDEDGQPLLANPRIFYRLRAIAMRKILDWITNLEAIEPTEMETLRQRIRGREVQPTQDTKSDREGFSRVAPIIPPPEDSN